MNKVVEAMESIEFGSITQCYPPNIESLQKRIDDAFEKTFGRNSTQYYRYSFDAVGFTSGVIMGGFSEPTVSEHVQELRANLPGCIETVREAVRSLEEELEEQGDTQEVLAVQVTHKLPSKKIFIVHGHDNEAKQTVARFVTDIDYKPIILHEQASGGRTVIEKIEANRDVDFAIVLLTPDDHGGKLGEAVQPRARQNVIFELGYFIGFLGRPKVFALTRGTVEMPSDFTGVVYHVLDFAGGWKLELAKEMLNASLQVDWNKVMK